MTTSAVRAPRPDAGPDEPSAGSGGPVRPRLSGSLSVAAVKAAITAAAAGLAVMTILVLIGWIAAPHLGAGLIGVLRTAAVLWLVGHHVAVSVKGAGRIGMLPLGLVLMPGTALWFAGRSLARGRQLTAPRQVISAALTVAVSYALITGLLAVLSQTALAAPSVPQAVLAGFTVAFVATWFGAARATAPWRRLGELMSAPSRSILAGLAGSLAMLAAAGLLTTAIALANHGREFSAMYSHLDAGIVGSGLLLLAELAYLPNALIWSVAYMLGPGFAVGAGTVVSPTGSVLGKVPAFPLLAALPAAPHAADPGWLAAALLAVPYLAGAIGGVLVVRFGPLASVDLAAIRGFCAGAGCGIVLGVLAGFSGGPLGDGRLSAVGPSAWQVTVVGVLELGIAAAISAALASLIYARTHRKAGPLPAPASAAMAPPSAATAPVISVPGQPTAPPSPQYPDPSAHVIFLDQWAAGQRKGNDPDHLRKGPSSLP